MSGHPTFTGSTLTVTDIPDERFRAGLFIKRMARDSADEALLRDVVLDEQRTVFERTQTKSAPKTAKEGTKPQPSKQTTTPKATRNRRTVMVDPRRAREHVRALVEQGMSLAAISRAAGVSPTAVHRLLSRPSTVTPVQGSIHIDREARILAVKYAPPTPPARCAQGKPFTPMGYRVGRCDDCGQLAPQRDGRLHAHPHPKGREA